MVRLGSSGGVWTGGWRSKGRRWLVGNDRRRRASASGTTPSFPSSFISLPKRRLWGMGGKEGDVGWGHGHHA
jgi:hypothetical protein